jgi:hypothetical protein
MVNSAERFEAALTSLVSEGSIKQRLTSAYLQYLEELRHDDLPVCVKNRFSELHAAMHRVAPIGNETRVKASVQKMSVAEAAGHAATIVKIYAELVGRPDRAEPLKVVESADKEPPWYLVSGS